MPNLIILFVLPFIAAILVLFLPNRVYKTPKLINNLSFFLSLIPLGYLGYLFTLGHLIGSTIDMVWVAPLSIHFHLSVDALSFIFLLITMTIVPFSLLALNEKFEFKALFCALIFVLEGLAIGFFMAKDLALFTIFWEAILLPIYFMMNLKGGAHRHSAAIHFLIYMIAGSALLVAAVLGLYFISSVNGQGTFNLDLLAEMTKTAPYMSWISLIFLLAFAVKTPLFPFHAWLIPAYTQSSTSGTILLSALLSKLGIYGFLRVGLPLFSQQMMAWNPILIALSITGVLYGGLAAWQQKDFKKLIAFSSFSHVNFILLGVFSLSDIATKGAILQSINHAVIITALFMVCGWLEQRVATTSMEHTGGLAHCFPTLCWITLFFSLANIALPGTNSFVGELLIFYGFFNKHPFLTAVLGLSIILSVLYMLKFMRKIYFEEISPFKYALTDLTYREICIAIPLIFMILWIGIYPSPLLQLIWETTK